MQNKPRRLIRPLRIRRVGSVDLLSGRVRMSQGDVGHVGLGDVVVAHMTLTASTTAENAVFHALTNCSVSRFHLVFQLCFMPALCPQLCDHAAQTLVLTFNRRSTRSTSCHGISWLLKNITLHVCTTNQILAVSFLTPTSTVTLYQAFHCYFLSLSW